MKFALRVVALLLVVLVAAGLIFYRYPLWVADQQLRFHLWREGVKSEYVEAGGYRLHYFEASAGNGGGGLQAGGGALGAAGGRPALGRADRTGRSRTTGDGRDLGA